MAGSGLSPTPIHTPDRKAGLAPGLRSVGTETPTPGPRPWDAARDPSAISPVTHFPGHRLRKPGPQWTQRAAGR